MSFFVRVLRLAGQDVEEILHFIAKERSAPEGARRWYQAYEAALDRLAKAAEMLPLAPENEFVDDEIRHLIFRTRKGRAYRTIFTIVGDEVRVLRVRGPGQNLMTEDQIERPDDG